jgi:GNAT superfamily N-acetyltransferase
VRDATSIVTQFKLIEIEDRPTDLRLFSDFYADIYIPEFPNANERESLENMHDYLRLKRTDWYGANNYHILVATVAGRPVGCIIADYLAESNSGVIEFLTVAPPWRHGGIGRALRIEIEKLLAADAGRTCGALDYVAAEMNDPFRTDLTTDNMDPVARALLWHSWGYRVIDFDYVQPALSPTQKPVCTLRLILRIREGLDRERIAAERLREILASYMRWAMRIEQADQASEFQVMARSLATCGDVAVCDLATYVARGGFSKQLTTHPSVANATAFTFELGLLRRRPADNTTSFIRDGMIGCRTYTKARTPRRGTCCRAG